MASKCNILPKELYPDCWSDENRVNVLFAPFRSKSVNPKDWESKYEFWRNLIKSYCLHFKLSFFRIEDLQKAFAKDGRIPACLPDVLREMHINRDLQTTKDFVNIPAETWSLWAADIIIKKPIIWSWNKLKSTVISTNNVDLNYVHTAALKSIAEDLGKSVSSLNIKSHIGDVKSIEDFSHHQVDNINILLNYLLINRKCSLREINTGDAKTTLIKFSDKGERITDREVDIYTLECTERIIGNSIEKYETEIQSIVKDAKNHLVKGHRQMAKTCLKKKKEIEKRVEARSNALFNVQTLLLRIEDTKDDVIVMDTYKKALSSLRTTFKSDILNEDAVADTMLELAEVLDVHDDIQSNLAQAIREDDADLEAELADLIASDAESKSPKPSKPQSVDNVDDLTKQLNDLRLPEVPTHSPLDHLRSDVN